MEMKTGMKLDLKALRAHAGRAHPFSAELALDRLGDVHQPLVLSRPLTCEGRATWGIERREAFGDGPQGQGHGHGHLLMAEGEEVIALSVRIRTRVERACSRCLRPVAVEVDREESLRLYGERPGQGQGQGLSPEAFTFEAQADELDLVPLLMGLIINGLEAKPLCRPDCKGLCPQCGADLNETPCRCAPQPQGDPRLAVLKRWLKT